MVVAERSLPTPEIRGSNPNIGNISNVFICQLLSRKDEDKEKEAGNGPLKKKIGVSGTCASPTMSCCHSVVALFDRVATSYVEFLLLNILFAFTMAVATL